MGDSEAKYLHKVQHLIETCLIFKLTKEESMEALLKSANMEPAITSVVWNELKKENREFFEAYEDQLKANASQVRMPGSQPVHKDDGDASEI